MDELDKLDNIIKPIIMLLDTFSDCNEKCEYYNEEKKQIKEKTVSNLIHSITSQYYKNGNIKFLKYNDKIIGEGPRISFYKNGKVCEIIIPNSIMHNSVYKKYFESGAVMLIIDRVNGKKHGNYNKYNENGILLNTATYVNDIKQQETIFYPNGNTKKKIMYVDGKIEGQMIKYYDANANVIRYIRHYINNKPQGECTEYNSDGHLFLKYNYVNGEIDGECIEYDEDGKIINITNYLN